MKTYRAELHIHTVLSPCAEVEMIPPLIIQTAVDMGIDLIAITDHNSTANIWAMIEASKDTGITILPGMELQTREEVHLLCLFDHIEQAESFQLFIDPLLPNLLNDPSHFGEQFVVDSTGDFIKSEEKLLLSSANISLDAAAHEVRSRGGLAIPAHVDRKAYGLLNMLGFFPPGLEVDAVEISRFTTPAEIIITNKEIGSYPIIQSGDAHRLNEILGKCLFDIHTPTINEIHKAFHNIDNRCFRLL